MCWRPAQLSSGAKEKSPSPVMAKGFSRTAQGIVAKKLAQKIP
jgi:hypothetical protein